MLFKTKSDLKRKEKIQAIWRSGTVLKLYSDVVVENLPPLWVSSGRKPRLPSKARIKVRRKEKKTRPRSRKSQERELLEKGSENKGHP